MNLKLALLILCLVFASCHQNQKVEWKNDVKQSKVFYDLEESHGTINRTFLFNLNARAKSGQSLKVKHTWDLEFVFVEVNGKAALVPHLIAASSGNSEYRKFSYPFIPDFDVTTYFYPDGTFDYGLTLCYVCDENAKLQKMRKGITVVNDNSSFLINRELQELFIDYTQKISDTIVINEIRNRKFNNINSENEWCKYLKVTSMDTMFVVSELSSSELLPKTLGSFKTITIEESGNYLDTLIFNRKDMMGYRRNYRK